MHSLFSKTFKILSILSIFCLLSPIFWQNALAAPQVKVVLLGQNFAVVEVDGERQTLHVGDPAMNGISLLAADSSKATLSYDGKQTTLNLGMAMGMDAESDLARANAQKLTVMKDRGGMYRINGKINTKDVHFLLDTGASTVVMSGETAKSLGIEYEKAKTREVSTASAHSKGYEVMLDHVMVGSIRLDQVTALVMPGHSPEEVLLGMSAISSLHIENDGDELIIKKK